MSSDSISVTDRITNNSLSNAFNFYCFFQKTRPSAEDRYIIIYDSFYQTVFYAFDYFQRTENSPFRSEDYELKSNKNRLDNIVKEK